MQEIKSLVRLIKKNFKNEKIINLHRPIFIGNEKKYINKTIDSTFVSSVGSTVKKFETKFKKYTNSKFAIATSSGTSALHISLILAGCNDNTEVITQPLTFVATSNAISYCGSKPIFVDVDIDNSGMSPTSLLEFLEKYGDIRNDGQCWNKKTNKVIKACLPMHSFGYSNRIDEIKKICRKFNLILVEDSAEALGSTYKGKHLGNYGQLAAFSFNGNKIITTGGGGMIVTNNEKLAKKARHISSTAKLNHKWNYFHDELGFNYRMPNLNAALGLSQIENINYFIKKKKILHNLYLDWSKRNGLNMLCDIDNSNSNKWLNILICRNRVEKNKILNQCYKNNIFVRPAWNLLNTLPFYKNCQTFNLINSKYLFDRIVCLPSSVSYE